MAAAEHVKALIRPVRRGCSAAGYACINVYRQLKVLVEVLLRFAVFRFGPSRQASSAAQIGDGSGKCLLMISYYASPYKSVYGTQRLDKFIKYLSRWGWKIVLITTQPPKCQIDSDAVPMPSQVEVVRLPQYEPRSGFWKGLLVPDHFMRWIDPALQASRSIIRERNPSAIFATVPPYSNAVAAALLSMETGIPLITDFRDAWTRIDTGWVIPNEGLRGLSGLLERVTLAVSEAVVMADEIRYADEFFIGGASRIQHKLHSILNGYDPEDFSAAPTFHARPSAGKFAVSYVGTLYDDETVTRIRRAFEQWQAAFPAEFDDVEFHYAGASSGFFDDHAFRPAYLRDHGYLSHRDAIALRMSSSAQIFCLPPRFKPHVISGKIYEMMRVPAPIVAITSPSGTVARFLDQTGTGIVASRDDPDCAAQALRELYLAWKSGRPAAVRRDEAARQFSRESQARQLSSVIEEVISDHSCEPEIAHTP